MTLGETLDWMRALGQCFPRLRAQKLRGALAALSGLRPSGRWEIGLAGPDGFSEINFRYFGEPGDYDGFRLRASLVTPAPESRKLLAPPSDFPWLRFCWNLGTDALADACLYCSASSFNLEGGHAVGLESGGGPVLFNPKEASAKLFPDAASSSVFSGLFPIKDILTEWEISPGARPRARERWSLRFQEPVPWPCFVSSNMADPLAKESSRLAYLLLNRRVTEVSFKGAALCLYLRA